MPTVVDIKTMVVLDCGHTLTLDSFIYPEIIMVGDTVVTCPECNKLIDGSNKHAIP